MNRQLSFIFSLIIILAVALPAKTVFAGKVEILGGYFDLTAKTDSSSGNVNAVGYYHFGYAHSLLPSLDLCLGYSLMMTQTVGGDLGYGADIGFAWYPISLSYPYELRIPGQTSFMISELWRPFVTISFHQRQYQSVQAAYAGFGISAGIERSFKHPISFKGEIRTITLNGPRQSVANEMDFFGGIVFQFQ